MTGAFGLAGFYFGMLAPTQAPFHQHLILIVPVQLENPHLHLLSNPSAWFQARGLGSRARPANISITQGGTAHGRPKTRRVHYIA